MGNVPVMADERLKLVPVGCGQCMECRKQKANGWKVRLLEEIRTSTNGIFVTLTFSDASIKKLNVDIPGEYEGYDRDNKIATLAVRRMLERWRAKFKKSFKHWLITELGHEGTENLHLHGIIFIDDWKQDNMNIPKEELIRKYWGYGFTYCGYSMSEKTVNYVVKYMMKPDPKHKTFKPIVLCSPGIGNKYVKRPNAIKNKYNNNTDKTDETYKTRKGFSVALPTYYRNKIYTEDEREILWLEKLDKQERWVDGTKVSVKDDDEQYKLLVQQARLKSRALGYNVPDFDEEQVMYENKLRDLRRLTRIENAKRKENEKILHRTRNSRNNTSNNS